jgi:processing peptidase subunit alpha
VRDVEELHKNSPALVTELLHTAAFQRNTLGNPLYARKAQYARLTAQTVAEFWKNHLSLDRIVVAGLNVNHDDLAAASLDLFKHVTPNAFQPRASAQYTGGEFRLGEKKNLVPAC